MEIVISAPYQSVQNVRTITIEQYNKRREQRRRRVAKRQLKRFPLFAVEFMRDEFPTYDTDTFVADVTRKTRKSNSVRKVKSPMIQQGRYWEMQKYLSDYRDTKNPESLQIAQKLRNRMYCKFKLKFQLKGETEIYFFPSYASYNMIQEIMQLKFKSWEELDALIDEKTRYGFR